MFLFLQNPASLFEAFFFGSPTFYFKVVETWIMVISLYMSLWLTNFLAVAIRAEESAMWAIVSLIPGVMSTLIYMYIIEAAAMLKVGANFDA